MYSSLSQVHTHFKTGESLYSTTHTQHTQLDNIEETLSERLYGLTEMFPPRLVGWCGNGWVWSYWLVRRCAWVVGTSMALLVLPPFIEQQRLEFEEMQNMQKKQVLNTHFCYSFVLSAVIRLHLHVKATVLWLTIFY